MSSIAIVIPCYNETKRLKKESILDLYYKTNADIFLVNDGSKDNTLALLYEISNDKPDRIKVIHHTTNLGKANTINQAIRSIIGNNYDYIGYFDADFSTPVSEIVRMLEMTEKLKPDFLVGSRIALLQSDIQRKRYRHYIGRIIVSIINFKHHLGIYDTQCGAKIFSKKIIDIAFSKPFKTKWLFDIEIFIRLKNAELLSGGYEMPLQHWKDVAGSKLSWKSITKVLREILIIYNI